MAISQEQYQTLLNLCESQGKRHAELQSLVNKMRDEKTDESMMVNGSLYPTFTQFRKWWDDKVKRGGENVPSDVQAYFADVVSLMVKTVTETDVSLIEDLSLEHEASQTNRGTGFAALHAK